VPVTLTPDAPLEWEGRCGRWMPKAKTWCWMTPDHAIRFKGSRCRTPDSWRVMTDRDSVRNKERSSSRRRFLNAYKLTVGCADCGYADNPVALDFDHDDPSLKLRGLAMMTAFAWEKILAELDKCTVRCSNCHRIKTHQGIDLEQAALH